MMSSVFVCSDSNLNVETMLVIALQKYWLISILIVFDIMASPVLNSELPLNVFALLKYWQFVFYYFLIMTSLKIFNAIFVISIKMLNLSSFKKLPYE